MFDLESIERRYLAGSPAAEDIPDLITEVRRLQAEKPKPTTPKSRGKSEEKNTKP